MHSIDMVEMCGSTDHECITGYDLYLNALNDLKLLMINGAHTFSKMFIENIIKDGAGNILQDTDAMQEMSLPVKKMPSEEGYTSHNSTVNTSVDDVTTNNNNQKEISDDSAAGADSQTAQLRYIKCRTTCDDILHNVVTRLTADCKTTLHLSFVKLLTNALESTVQELIIAPSYEVPITSGYIHIYIYMYIHCVVDNHVMFNCRHSLLPFCMYYYDVDHLAVIITVAEQAVLPAQKLIKREVKEFIMLNCLGEDMVRAAVQDFIFEFTQDLALESSSRLNIIAVQLLSD